ncbi:MAG: hypothetical protein ACRD2X_27840 [Vicinamibacteraceae bacterium]
MSTTAARELERTRPYSVLLETIRQNAQTVHVMPAYNVKRIADVTTARPGLFLFNHFVAANREVLLRLWDYLAEWYVVETGLDNSVALAPMEGAPSAYAIVNWARWDVGPLRHFWHSLSKRTFWRYVTANLANRAASITIYCRLA